MKNLIKLIKQKFCKHVYHISSVKTSPDRSTTKYIYECNNCGKLRTVIHYRNFK